MEERRTGRAAPTATCDCCHPERSEGPCPRRSSHSRTRSLAFARDDGLRAVVRRFPRDGHVVRVRLAQARGGDLDHLDVALELLDGGDAAIAHATTEPADHLIQYVGHGTL